MDGFNSVGLAGASGIPAWKPGICAGHSAIMPATSLTFIGASWPAASGSAGIIFSVAHSIGLKGNPNARPVIAVVDGERFEVTPESGESKETKPKVEKRSFSPHQSSVVASSPNPAAGGDTLTAPLPGTVVNVFVKAGDKVEAGQVVLVIEAMKMKNSIRSLYSGSVGEVLVETGQSVAHNRR